MIKQDDIDIFLHILEDMISLNIYEMLEIYKKQHPKFLGKTSFSQEELMKVYDAMYEKIEKIEKCWSLQDNIDAMSNSIDEDPNCCVDECRNSDENEKFKFSK